MNQAEERNAVTQPLTKLMAALADHLDLLTSQHQSNSNLLINALEAREAQAETSAATSTVENVALVKAYQGLDAMEQRLQFLRKAMFAVGELLENVGSEEYHDLLDDLMLTLERRSPVTTDGRLYALRRNPEHVAEGCTAHKAEEVEGSVILFDDDADSL